MNSAPLVGEDALQVWPIVEPLIKMATDRDRGRSTPETIRQLIEDGKATLWVHKGFDLAWVTTIEEYPTGVRSCLVRVCGGKGLDVCKEEIENVARYAKAVNCDLLEIYGREGWLKALNGFTKDVTVMTREL